MLSEKIKINFSRLDNFFINFGKLDEHSKINRQGTGLGLSICKKIVEQMGGQLRMDSLSKLSLQFY